VYVRRKSCPPVCTTVRCPKFRQLKEVRYVNRLIAALGLAVIAASVAGQALAADTHPQPLQKQPNHHPAPPVQPQKTGGGVKGFGYQVISPRDAASGLASGKRNHGPTL
jgi:hypothetical protein